MPEPLGRATIFPLKGKKVFVTVVDVAVIRTRSKNCNNEFLLYQINSPGIRKQIETFKSGTTRKRISRKNLSKVEFLLCPLPEQRAIVTKLDTLFSELDAGIAAFTQAKKQLKVYRQSILKQAFSGELTREWREQQVGLPTAGELLGGIEEKRTHLQQTELAKWVDAVKQWEKEGRTGKKAKKPSKYKQLELDDLFQEYNGVFPKEWTAVTVNNLVQDMCLGKMLDKAKNTGVDRTYLGNINVRWGTFRLENLKSIKIQPEDFERYSTVANDVIICEGGEPGRCAIWKSKEKVIIQKALHRVRLFQDVSLSEYFYYYMEYAIKMGYAGRYFTGTTIKHLTGKGLAQMGIMVPSIKEQHQIVQEIETRFSVCDQLEADIEINLKKSESLRQSLLKKAFAGELLTEGELAACRAEADWEPAGVLLERIKGNKGAKKKKK
jgi:type I restriction enzyme S subunit